MPHFGQRSNFRLVYAIRVLENSLQALKQLSGGSQHLATRNHVNNLQSFVVTATQAQKTSTFRIYEMRVEKNLLALLGFVKIL